MTRIGEYLYRMSISPLEVARKAGIDSSRLNKLCNTDTTPLGALELYKIFLAMGVNPAEGFTDLYQDVILAEQGTNPSDSFEKSKESTSAQ